MGAASSTNATVNNPPGLNDVTREANAENCEVVQGAVPSWIDGVMYRQAGGAFAQHKPEDEGTVLDGLAHILSFSVSPGRDVEMTNKFLRTTTHQRWVNHPEKREWGTVAGRSKNIIDKMWTQALDWFERDTSLFSGFNPNVTIWRLGNNMERLAASTEANGILCEFDPVTLETKGSAPTMRPKSDKTMIITHPAHYNEYCDALHVAIEMTNNGGFPPTFDFNYAIYYQKFGATGEGGSGDTSDAFTRIHEEPIASFDWTKRDHMTDPKDRFSYMHCTVETTSYVILLLSSARVMYSKLLAQDFSDGFFGLFEDTQHPLSFMVFEKVRDDAGSVTSLNKVGVFSADTTMHVWHIANAFESASGVVTLDATTTRGLQFTDAANVSMLRRFVIDTNKSTVVDAPTGQEGFEFPQCNPLFHNRQANYVWTAGIDLPDTKTMLLRTDLSPLGAGGASAGACGSGPVQQRIEMKGKVTECVFVPRGWFDDAYANDELEGVVLCVVVNVNDQGEDIESSDLVMVDARSSEIVARVRAPMVCNYGLHSYFFPRGKPWKVKI